MSSPSPAGESLSFALIPPLVASAILLFLGLIIVPNTHTTPKAASSPAAAGGLAPFFAPEVRRWEAEIFAWATTYNLPPELVATVMQIESCGDPLALSPAGARGLFQVMPYHFAPGEDPFDPETNARRGLEYLQRSWQAAGQDPARALAGYNGGLGVLTRPADQWPAETQRYVYWGAQIYADAQAQKSRSPRLEEWLQSGGSSLCAQAASRP